MNTKNKHAIISGGGIGGLTTALALVQTGWHVTVLEQASEVSEVGAGIQISPNGCKVLAELGVLGAVEQLAFAPEKIEMRVGKTGSEVFAIPLKNYAQQRWGAPYLHIHRADLITALAGALRQQAPQSLKLGCRVVGYENKGHSVAALLDDGRILEGDILVAADGIHSAIRTQMLGDQPARFTGNVAWRATVPMEELGKLAPPPTACVWVGKGRHAVTYQLRGGEMANIVGVVERDDWQQESWLERGSREEALADFSGWHPTIRTLFEKAQKHYRWALFDRPALPHWHDGRAVMVGDSCHPMLPFLAQGATMAMEDALTLARCLAAEQPAHRNSQPVNAETAFERYFAARVERTTAVQAGARKNMKVFHKPGIAYAPVRLATGVKPDLMHERMDWIYSHVVPRNF